MLKPKICNVLNCDHEKRWTVEKNVCFYTHLDTVESLLISLAVFSSVYQ